MNILLKCLFIISLLQEINMSHFLENQMLPLDVFFAAVLFCKKIKQRSLKVDFKKGNQRKLQFLTNFNVHFFTKKNVCQRNSFIVWRIFVPSEQPNNYHLTFSLDLSSFFGRKGDFFCWFSMNTNYYCSFALTKQTNPLIRREWMVVLSCFLSTTWTKWHM